MNYYFFDENQKMKKFDESVTSDIYLKNSEGRLVKTSIDELTERYSGNTIDWS